MIILVLTKAFSSTLLSFNLVNFFVSVLHCLFPSIEGQCLFSPTLFSSLKKGYIRVGNYSPPDRPRRPILRPGGKKYNLKSPVVGLCLRQGLRWRAIRAKKSPCGCPLRFVLVPKEKWKSPCNFTKSLCEF
jgi:hypothetical protein